MRRFRLDAVTIAGGYALVAIAWIFISDWLATAYFPSELTPAVQTYKGIAFVLVTSAVLYGLLEIRHRALRRSLGRSRRLADQLLRSQQVAHIGSWEADLQKETLSWSDEVFRIFGIDRETFGGTEEAFFSLVHPDDREALREQRRRFLESGEPLDATHRIVRPDGSVRWVREQAEVLYGEDGEPRYTSGTVQDVTKQVEAETEVARQRGLLEIAARIAGVGAWSVELPECAVTWSDEVARIHGMSPGYAPTLEEGIGFFAPEYRAHIRAVFDACVSRGEPYDEEVEIIAADGSRIWVRVVGDPERDRDGSVARVRGAFMDITRQRNTMRRLESQARSLRRLATRLIDAQETERRRLARELHDEIGQSLTLVAMSLRRHAAAAPDSQHLKTALQQLDTLTGQLRSVSVQLSPQLLEQLGLLAAIEALAERHEQSLQASLQLDLLADESRIPRSLRLPCYRIVQESLTNAVRHARATRIGILVEENENVLELTIGDDGRGFDVDDFLGKDSCPAGFGLINMRERAELSGGELRVESTPGAGTTVQARFPLESAGATGQAERGLQP